MSTLIPRRISELSRSNLVADPRLEQPVRTPPRSPRRSARPAPFLVVVPETSEFLGGF